jgi:hypothetical protein
MSRDTIWLRNPEADFITSNELQRAWLVFAYTIILMQLMGKSCAFARTLRSEEWTRTSLTFVHLDLRSAPNLLSSSIAAANIPTP